MAALVVLIVTSAIVRDYYFIVANPGKFMIELVFFSVIPSLLIALVIFKTRNIPVKDTISWLLVMIFKFAVFHILFQLSGIYTVILTPKM